MGMKRNNRKCLFIVSPYSYNLIGIHIRIKIIYKIFKFPISPSLKSRLLDFFDLIWKGVYLRDLLWKYSIKETINNKITFVFYIFS